MLIDDQFLVAGSSNFDYLSYRLYQEVVAVFTNKKLVDNFRTQVMLPDLAHSIAVDCQSSALEKYLLGFQVRVLDTALTILT